MARRTLTRRELYDLVWTTPITKLAEEHGISDVGLLKTCQRYRVTTPPRGYWAKADAGNQLRRPSLLRYPTQRSTRSRSAEPLPSSLSRRSEALPACSATLFSIVQPLPQGSATVLTSANSGK
jgi:hypothetical protein